MDWKLRPRLDAQAGTEARARGKACGFPDLPPPQESFAGGGARPQAPSFVRKCPRSGIWGDGGEWDMPTPVKALENMSKNLTDEERQLREQA